MKTALFTICARNYVPYARTLMKSARTHQPGVDRITVIADAPGPLSEEFSELGRLVFAGDLNLPKFDHFAFRYDVTEFNTAIKPFVIRRLMDEGYDVVLYVDPDIKLYGPMEEALELLAGGSANAVVTPHLLQPLVDTDEPNDLTILRAGVYNLGFAGFKDSGQTRSFLDWWCSRLEHECLFNRLESGIFVDQKWVDMLPCFVDDVSILRHPGYNVAYWNLLQRRIDVDESGPLVNGRPLVFFHFSGVVPGDRKIFSKHQKRFTPKNISAETRRLFDEYMDGLEDHEVREARKEPYAFGFFSSGDPIVPAMRYIFREELEPFDGNPFEELYDVFNEPDPRVGRVGNLLITRLMYRIWRERPDLRASFDLRAPQGQEGLMRWYLSAAQNELGISARFVEPVRSALSTSEQAHDRAPRLANMRSAFTAGGAWPIRFLRRYQRLYQYLPETPRKRVKNVLLKLSGHPPEPLFVEGAQPDYALFEHDQQITECIPEHGAAQNILPGGGVLLVGYAKAEMGVGQGLRLQARALDAVNVDFRVFNVEASDVYQQNEHTFVHRLADNNPYGWSIHHVNADQAASVRQLVPASAREGYAIGYWAWELSRFPQAWHQAFEYFDEIWVPSSFVQQAVAQETSKPVIVMPHAISRPAYSVASRQEYGVENTDFLVLSSFDFNSFMSRKNPTAAIEAFQSAFSSDCRDAVLILKTHGGEVHSNLREQLLRRIEGDTRIRLIDEVLPADSLVRLQASADVFLSLHRSEGFGLNLAECMALGKPVVATAYSGNVDFMHVGNSCPVNYELISVPEGEYPFSEGQVWAEPDVEHAAAQLRRLYEEPDFRERIGVRASEDMEFGYSPEAIGRRIKHRLQSIGCLE